jgi:hypothetical protein
VAKLPHPVGQRDMRAVDDGWAKGTAHAWSSGTRPPWVTGTVGLW